MKTTRHTTRVSAWGRACCALVLATAGTGAAWAQYKVVAADGSVTYTDRPQAAPNARITTLSRAGAAQPLEAALPLELRQATQRYPVTLYTGNDCVPCDNGRRLLQQRGIPYAERRVSSEEDALALERAVGGRTVPALTIGAQPLRGLSETDWTAYLDVAGYPRVSKLPRDWQPAVVQPMAGDKLVAARPTTAPRPPPLPPEGEAEPVSGVRF